MSATTVFEIAAAVIASLGGGALLVFALSSWLGKVWASRILEQDRRRYGEEIERVKTDLERATRALQAQLDKTVFVHRLQFETEFRAVSDVWAKLSRVRAAFSAVRPVMSVGPIDETDEDKREALRRRLRELIESYNPARQALDDQSPFYPETIYQAADAAMRTANLEIINVSTDSNPFRIEWWDRGRNNCEKFLEHMDTLSARIRARLAELAVYRDHEDSQ